MGITPSHSMMLSSLEREKTRTDIREFARGSGFRRERRGKRKRSHYIYNSKKSG